MDVLETIKARRSARSFTGQRLEPHIVEAIEEAILHSPSASNAQESHFVIVQDEVRIRHIKRFAQGLSGQPAAVVVLCSNHQESLARGGADSADMLRFINLGVAASAIMLTAQSLGASSCPVRSFHAPSIAAITGLPEEVKPELLISLGYADKPPRPKTSKPPKEMISFERYGN
ncbi:nitroreductase family protein [Paenibacillus sp. S28]|uniref:nitroreductase family protein n=1 Tax=Paenibacillus sp. S28 TaxID=2767463 RepID=UPI00190A4AC9|nr:nitroreductase family protein [Paenibacillus sp. S28]MBJ9987960.1 nitroreductase family protein [Paenibacillus sp. S28]